MAHEMTHTNNWVRAPWSPTSSAYFVYSYAIGDELYKEELVLYRSYSSRVEPVAAQLQPKRDE